jgi:hypothetical protein
MEYSTEKSSIRGTYSVGRWILNREENFQGSGQSKDL